MYNKLFNYLYQMRKQIITILSFIIIFILVILLFKNCNRQIKLIENNNGWETLKKEKEKELLRKDSIYLDLKMKTDFKIKKLEKEIIIQEKNYQKQLKEIKKKYDKEYSKVSATTIDSTIIISARFLSEEINYSKFQK